MPAKNPKKRLWVDEHLEFTLTSGDGKYGLTKGGVRNYITLGKMVATAAARQCGWNLPAYRPIYVIVTVNLPDNHDRAGEEREWASRTLPHKLLPVRTPSISRVIDIVTKILTGTVIKKPSQIVGSMIIKKLSKKETSLEVFVGAPTDWVELNHDIRNG